MRSIALSEAKDSLSSLVDEVEREHEIVRITRHGRGAAIIMSEDELESLYETLFWLSQPGIHDDVDEAERSSETGGALGADAVQEVLDRARSGG